MTEGEDRDVIEAGYRPQLQRNIGRFASFAVPYSFMSVLMGIFANYSFVLNTAGPFGIWTWPLVGVGQLLVALTFAEMASRLPLTGSLYNWNSRLSNRGTAWLVAWMLVFGYAVSVPGIILAMLPPLQSFFGIQLGSLAIDTVGIGVIIAQLLINMYGIRLTAHLNRIAVVLEIVAIVAFGILLLAFLLLKGAANTAILTTIPKTPAPYLVPFLMCILLGAYTMTGFESASDLSEETNRVKYVAPRSIVYAVASSAVLGFLFLVLITLAIPNLATITSSSDPISAILGSALGVIPAKILLGLVILAMFAVEMITMTLASRLLFAVARDGHVAGSSFLSKISARKIPANSLIVVAIIEILAFTLLSGFVALYAAPVLMWVVAYLITVFNFVRKPEALPTASDFSLGKWRLPIAVAAIGWLLIELVVLTVPQEFNLAAYIAIGIILVGGCQYVFVERARLKRRSVSTHT